MTTQTAANVPTTRAEGARADDTFILPSLLAVAAIYVGSWVADQVGSKFVVFLIFWGPLLFHYMLQKPVHLSARMLLLLGLVLEPPDENAGHNYWVPPFVPASDVMYHGIKHWTGIPGLSVTLFTVLAVVLFLRARKAERPRGYVPVPPEAWKMWRFWLLSLLGLMVWGIAVRGGEGQPSYWQVIQLVTMGFCALAFVYSIRGPSDFRALGTVIVIVALVKGALVAWVYFVVCSPLNIKPFYATTHSDSVNFAVAFLVISASLFEYRDKRNFRRFLILAPLLILIIIMNNRRLAFASVGLGAITTYAVLRKSKLKKTLTTIALCMVPVLFAYVKIGANSSSPIFVPAVMIDSMMNSTDSSSITREIENYNLIKTMQQDKILGKGFGHEYIEFVRADDISEGFSLFRYMPHNSVLWLWSMGGLIGATILWMIYPVTCYFAARGYKNARGPLERATGLIALAATVACLVQDWGDMGLHSYTTSVMFGMVFAVAAKLCMATELPTPQQRVKRRA